MSAVSTMGVNCLLVLVARVLLVLHHVEVVAGALVTREAVQHYHQQAVPVIHLDQGKATVDDLEHYLRMFPEQLLASNKRVKPIDVRKIEHEDFIDYEIEFVELPNENIFKKADANEFILQKTEISDANRDEQNKIQDDSIGYEKPQSFGSEPSKEVNLVNFVDLYHKARTKQRSRSGDIRRRRRIKLKRDPVRSSAVAREINDSSNQIDTSTREQNNFSQHTFTKPRTVIRNLIQIPETDRKATVLDRRTVPHQRVSSFRSRKRVPLKFGRSFNHDDRPSDQLIRLRGPEIIAKLERSTNNERNVIKTTDKSEDDLDDKNSVHQSEEDGKDVHVTLDSTSSRRKTFPILTSVPSDFINNNNAAAPAPNKSSPDTDTNTNVVFDLMMNKGAEKAETQLQGKLIRKADLSLSSPTPSITTTTTTSARVTTKTPHGGGDLNAAKDDDDDARESNERVTSGSLSTIQITTPSTTRMTAETTSTPLMMYPEVFTQLPVKIQTTNQPLTTTTTQIPLSLLSVFGSKPRSSRLQIVRSETSSSPRRRTEVSWSQSRSHDTQSEIVSVFSSQQRFTTVSSALKFSIISTSTETSAPLYEATTIIPETVTDHPLFVHKNEQVLPEQSETKSRSRSTTISLPSTTTSVIGAVQKVAAATTTDLNEINEVLTELQQDDDEDDSTTTTTHKTLTANELKFEGITTTTGVRSIMDDNQIMTTPIPEDLQLSESITSVYLHNSSLMPSVSNNNIKTSQTKPKKDSVNSITLLPFSKLTNQILDSDGAGDSSRNDEPPSASARNEENIYTVTPVYVSSRHRQRQTTTPIWQQMEYDTTTTTTEASENDSEDDGDENIPTTTLSDSQQDLESMYSGQYHEDNPGQYHEVNPGQYHEINPGQYHEISPGQYHEVNPGQYDEVNPGQYQHPKYQNLESAYPGDYEVNEVKVDFDNRDEHKIYNVQAKAGDFIIGEVGKIDVNNGQTVEGVRYTALEGEVDPLKIAEILNRYFGTRTS